jgi:transposase
MGTQSTTSGTFTEYGGGLDPAGTLLYVGVDVGRRSHVVAAIPRSAMETGAWERMGVRSIPTVAAGYLELADWLESFGVPREAVGVGLEPTGGWYGRTVVAWLEARGYRVEWLQNWALHEKRQLVLGKQTKTDALDARLLARLLYERDLMGANRGFLHHRPHNADALRMLVRNRLKLVNLRSRYRLQLGALEDVVFPELKEHFRSKSTGPMARAILERFPTPAALVAATQDELVAASSGRGRGVRLVHQMEELQTLAAHSAGVQDDMEQLLGLQRWLLRQLHVVDAEIQQADGAVAEALGSWPERDREILASLPSVSTLRQAVLLATIGDWRSFDNDRQLRKLLGWYPEARESGSSLSVHRLGSKGSRLARREIWLWTMSLLAPQQAPTPFRTYYQRLRERGMRGNAAVGHVAGKLISVLFHCLKSDELYDPERHARDLGCGDS